MASVISPLAGRNQVSVTVEPSTARLLSWLTDSKPSAAADVLAARYRAENGLTPDVLTMDRWASDETTVDPLYAVDMAPGADETPYDEVLADHIRRSLAAAYAPCNRSPVVYVWRDDADDLPETIEFEWQGQTVTAHFYRTYPCKYARGVVEAVYDVL